MPSKRYTSLKEQIEPTKIYSVEEAIALAKKSASTKFDEALELHMNLGIDTEKGDQQVRGTIALPHGIGKSKKVVAFVEAEKEAEAKTAGADIVGGEELIAEMAQKGTVDFDVAVATPTIMSKVAKLAKVLGPRGLMPNPKTDTVGTNISKMVTEQKAGKLSFKNDAGGNVHIMFGKVSFDDAKLIENLTALTEALKKLKPTSSKGIFVKSACICSTMGPGIKVDVA